MNYFANYVRINKVHSLVNSEPPTLCHLELVIDAAEDIGFILFGRHVNCITESGAQDLNVVDGLEPFDWLSNAPLRSPQS